MKRAFKNIRTVLDIRSVRFFPSGFNAGPVLPKLEYFIGYNILRE